MWPNNNNSIYCTLNVEAWADDENGYIKYCKWRECDVHGFTHTHLHTNTLTHIWSTAVPAKMVRRKKTSINVLRTYESLPTASNTTISVLTADFHVNVHGLVRPRQFALVWCGRSGRYKLGVTDHRCLHNKAPQYLVDCRIPVSDIASRQRLHAARRCLLTVPHHHRNTLGHRAFSVELASRPT